MSKVRCLIWNDNTQDSRASKWILIEAEYGLTSRRLAGEVCTAVFQNDLAAIGIEKKLKSPHAHIYIHTMSMQGLA